MPSFTKYMSTEVEMSKAQSQISLGRRTHNDDGEDITSPSALSSMLVSDTERLPLASNNGPDVHSIINGPTSSIIADHHMDPQHSSAPCDGNMVWYCDNCGNGPMGTWYSACTGCGHYRCGGCTVEETA